MKTLLMRAHAHVRVDGVTCVHPFTGCPLVACRQRPCSAKTCKCSVCACDDCLIRRLKVTFDATENT